MVEFLIVGLGGGLGSLLRYALGQLFPTAPGAFPATTFAINVSGCFCIGALMAAILERWPRANRSRLFLGTGVLGGYTTFLTYTVEAVRLAQGGRVLLAVGYIAATAVCALAAAVAGVWLARRALRMTARGDG